MKRAQTQNHKQEIYMRKEPILEETVVLASEGVLKIRVKSEQGVLTEVLNFIPRVEDGFVLIRTRERHLYSDAAVYGSPSVFAVVSSDGTVLIVEAHEV